MLTLRGQMNRFCRVDFLFRETKSLKPNELSALTIAFWAAVRGLGGAGCVGSEDPGPVLPMSEHPAMERTVRIAAA
jgi:hypothetical protein